MKDSKAKNNANGGRVDNNFESLIIINSGSLVETFTNMSGFGKFPSAIFLNLNKPYVTVPSTIKKQNHKRSVENKEKVSQLVNHLIS